MNRRRWILLDTGLLHALLEPGDGLHQEVRELVAGERFHVAVSAWSWAELLDQEAGARDWPRALREPGITVRAVDVAVLDTAARLLLTHPRPVREAVLVATALRLEAEALVTADPALTAAWPEPPQGLKLAAPADFLGPQQIRLL